MSFATSPEIPPPWREFLREVDEALPEPTEIRCLGGFVITLLHGFPRPTSDLDYIETIPAHAASFLQEVAGLDSQLHAKHGVYLQYVTVADLPESYEDRLTPLFAGLYRNLRLVVLDPYDLLLSKLTRNSPIDQDDVEYLTNTMRLDPLILSDRYYKELRPIAMGDLDKHDQTLRFWIDTYFST